MIFPSTLIISTASSTLTAKINSICITLKNPINVNNPDILTIGDNNNWTIENVRQIKNFFSKKPFSHQNKIVIIYQTDQLGIPAQNALLKTLEEPGKNNYLILSCAKPQSLLPTILSRCQIIHLRTSPPVKTGCLIPISPNLAQNLSTADRLASDKNSVLPLIKQELHLKKMALINHPNQNTAQLIKKLIHATQLITHNVDPRSALDYYLLFS